MKKMVLGLMLVAVPLHAVEPEKVQRAKVPSPPLYLPDTSLVGLCQIPAWIATSSAPSAPSALASSR